MRKWLPAAPAGAPGVWSHLQNMIPDVAGAYHPGSMFGGMPGISGPASPGTTLRAWCALLADDTATGYVGTTTKLWHFDGSTTFTDRSVGGGYTNTATDWSFAQFGNITLATNRVDAVQTRDSSGGSAFANATGSPPKARIAVSQSDQVLLFDLNDGAEKPDAFAACAPGDHTDWSSAGATTATRIRHRPGKITAATAFRDHVLVFKKSSVYRLTYTGNNTFKWRVELIAMNRGALGQHDVVNCGDFVIFRGRSGAWVYDGASFTPVGEYLITLASSTPSIFTIASCGSLYDAINKNVYFFQPSTNRALVYNLTSDRWGQFNASSATANITSFRPFTGEVDARAALLPSLTSPEQLFLVDLSTSPYVYQSDTLWGGGTTADAAYLISGIDGEGGARMFHYSSLELDCTNSLASSVDPTPGDTELIADAYGANRKDHKNLLLPATGLPTPKQSNIPSHGDVRRFDLDFDAVFARFQVSLICSSGYLEINDLAPVKTPAGEAL